MKSLILSVLSGIGLQLNALSQSTPTTDFANETYDLNRKGMYVLGGWALGNLAYSGLSLPNSEGEAKAFHQMNMSWAVIDGALALSGILSDKKRKMPDSPLETLELQNKFEKIFLLNAGLDVAYVTAGIGLEKYSQNPDLSPEKQEQYRGFGKSVVIQGGFLMLFDSMMYLLHHRHYRNQRMEFVSDGKSLGVKYALDKP